MRRILPLLLLCFTTSCVHAQGSWTGTGTITGSGKVGPPAVSPCAINPPSFPTGIQGSAYGPIQMTSTGCSAPIVWSLTNGTFPTGISMTSGGLVSGTPSGSGTSAITITLLDHAGHAPIFPASVTITATSSPGTPLAPDSALTSWDTSLAGTPNSNITDCVGTPLNSTLLPGGRCASNFPGTTAGAQAALNAVACGHVINFANIQGLTALTIPSNKKCANNAWIWLAFHDLSDPVFPDENTRVDPCYIGIPQTAMPYYPYPTAHSTPNNCARHMSQIITTATSNNACLRMSIPSSGTNTPSIGHWRIMGLDCTRDQSADALTALISLDYQPNASGQDCAVTGTGNTSLPANAAACAADQYDHLVIDRNVIHGDAVRQTVRAISLGGGTFLRVKNNYVYDIQDTFAGGQGDAQSFAGGFGKGYTGVGDWMFDNNFSASSSEGTLFCGAFTEAKSPVTNADGIPDSVIWNYDWFYKPMPWDTQRGQTLNETLINEGTSYPPIGDQEIVWQPTAFQVQQGLSFSLNNTWLNDSAGGWNRFNITGTPPNNTGTATVDGIAYTTVTSASGILTKSNVTVGSNPWQATNIIQWSYAACTGAGNPIAACTTATTPGTHTIAFGGVVLNDGLADVTKLGNNRTLTTTITATVTAGAPTNQLALTPSAPDLQIQPSYSDAFGNNRNFAYVFTAIANFTSVSLTWKVDGIVNGDTSVGRICSVTAVPCAGPASNDSRVVYVSGTATGSHTISVTSAAGTTTSQAISVSTSSPIWGYDLKAMTVKNMWEAKCLTRGLLQNSLLENTWGSQGNGGGQNNALLNQAINQSNQVTDGSGANVGYGPGNISDFNANHLHILDSGGGLVVAALGQSKGIHRLSYSDILLQDLNGIRYGHGFLHPQFDVFVQFSGATGATPLSWTSATTPLANDVNFSHITSVGGTATTKGINSWLSVANNVIGSITTIVNVALASNVVTITGTNSFAVGNRIRLLGLTTSTYLNGQEVFVTSATVNQFTAAFTHVDDPSHSDTGTAAVLTQYQLGAFSVKDSVFQAPGTIPFTNNNGENGDCNHNNITETESTAFLGTGYTPAIPCFSSYSLARNLLIDNTSAPSVFVTPTIWQTTSTATDLFRNASAGDYRFQIGSQYAAGGTKDASDGSALGADIEGISAAEQAVRLGVTTGLPFSISTSSLPNATHNVAYSQTLSVSGGTAPYTWTTPADMTPAGTIDTVNDYAAMPLPDRNNFHLSGTIVKYFHVFPGLLVWDKGASGHPWDGEVIGSDYIKQWFTEGATFSNASGFKMYQTPVSLWKRYHVPGADDVVYTPGPNNYSTTANCGADGSPLIDNLGVRGELTGPFTDVTWQSTYGGDIPDGTPYLLAQKWIKCTANDILNCTNEEDYWLVKGYGQVRWCPKTLSGGVYVTGSCTQETSKVAGGAPTLNFACGLPQPPTSTLPTGALLTTGPAMNLVDSTGVITGTPNAPGTYTFTVQVQDANGLIAQKTFTLTVN